MYKRCNQHLGLIFLHYATVFTGYLLKEASKYIEGPRAHILTTVSQIKKHRKIYSARSKNRNIYSAKSKNRKINSAKLKKQKDILYSSRSEKHKDIL